MPFPRHEVLQWLLLTLFKGTRKAVKVAQTTGTQFPTLVRYRQAVQEDGCFTSKPRAPQRGISRISFSPFTDQANFNSSHWFCGYYSPASADSLCHSHVHTTVTEVAERLPGFWETLAPAYLNSLGKTATCVVCFTLNYSLSIQAENSAVHLAGRGPCNLAAYTFVRMLTARAV